MSSKKPSKVAKERLSHLLEQEVLELGRVARQLCRRSGSREVGACTSRKRARCKLIWFSLPRFL